MSAPGTRGRRRGLLVIAGIVVLGIVAASACKWQHRGPNATSGEVTFKPGGVVGTYLSGFDLVQDHLWVATERGIAVVDPVDETWTMLQLGSRNLQDTRIVPCESQVWILARDSVLLVDLKTRTVQPRALPPPLLNNINNASCGSDGLWLYSGRDGGLYKLPLSETLSARYETRGPGRPQYVRFVEALQNGVYLLAPQYTRGQTPDAGLFRFNPTTSALTRVDLPRGAPPVSLDRTDDGLVVRALDSSAFLLKVDGQAWTELPQQAKVPLTTFGTLPVLAQGNGVVWVGASYDVSPASYFVLRYIHDAMEPKDLVILPRDWYGGGARRTVQYLGMLWTLLGSRVLRIDANAEELVSYELTDSTGKLKKQSFSLAKDSTGLRFFDGNTVRAFSEEPASVPESPDSANLGKEPER